MNLSEMMCDGVDDFGKRVEHGDDDDDARGENLF